MGRLSLMIDLERCIGCKSCEVACKQEHGLGPGEFRNRVVWLGDRGGPALDFLTVTCQHCDRPACLRACPVNPKAITKDPETGRQNAGFYSLQLKGPDRLGLRMLASTHGYEIFQKRLARGLPL